MNNAATFARMLLCRLIEAGLYVVVMLNIQKDMELRVLFKRLERGSYLFQFCDVAETLKLICDAIWSRKDSVEMLEVL